jgi:uncharacterized protein (DUF1800 family)
VAHRRYVTAGRHLRKIAADARRDDVGVPLSRFTRRRLLATTGMGAGALALAPLLPLSRRVAAATPTPWPSPLHTPRAAAAHLLRRTSFGYNSATLDAAAAMPYRDLVESILAQAPQSPTFPDADTQCSRWKAAPVWIRHMATTASPFPERMALFWHGHLTSSSEKCPFEFNYMTLQIEMFRRFGLSDLRTLLVNFAYSAALMEWLDLQESTAGAPNENFARELMELFTLGPGNYTEGDVREAARALTGYRIQAYDAGGTPQPWPRWGPTQDQYVQTIHGLISQGWTWRGALVSGKHDSTSKTFLGRTGNWGLEGIIDIILAQPACATFVASKAIAHFMGVQVAADSSFVAEVASRFRQSGYDIKTLMRCIFRGGDTAAHPGVPVVNRFLTAPCYRGLLRTPIEYVIAATKATGWTTILDDCDWYTQMQGMMLLTPPNVSGWWHGDGYWVGSSTWLSRLNFASAVAWDGRASNPSPTTAVADQLDGVLSSATQSALGAQTSSSGRWYALLGSPEFQMS